jgi:branched-chain amino acid transport system substrate-binding protein
MKVSKKRVLAAAGLLVAVAMIGSGCSGTSSTSSSSSGAPSVKTVKIGIGAPLTAGAVALGQGMQRGAQLAIDQANASETVKAAGIKFVSVTGDDQGDPKTGVNVANQFVSDTSLIGVMGHLNSGVSIPASKVYNQAGVVMISPASTNPALTGAGGARPFDNVFRVCTIDSVQGPAGAAAAFKELGKKSVFVVDDSTPYGTGLADAFQKQFETLGGKVLGREKTSDKDTDFKALVTKIAPTNPELVYYGGIYNAGALLAKQLKEGGVKAPFMGGDGLYDPEFIKLAGASNAEGDFATSVGLPLANLPKGQEFKAEFEKKYPGQEIAAYDAYSYDAATVIGKAALEAAKSLGADKVATAEGKKAIVANVQKFNGEGVTGTISFDANGDTTNKAITLYTVQGGKWGPKIAGVKF